MHADFFTKNRTTFYEQLPANSFVALAGFTQMQGANDQPAPFEQEGNFWYLTGIEESDWRLLANTDSGEEWLVSPHRSFARLMFDGGLTAEQATARSGIRHTVDAREGAAILKTLLAQKKRAYTVLPLSLRRHGLVPNPAPRRLAAQLKAVEVVDARITIERQRAIKQPAEIAALQDAIDVTIDGLLAVLPTLKTAQYEYEAEAMLTYEFRRRGYTHGFAPIVAAGPNTTVLHHPLPKDAIKPNDWLLMDVGARRNRYAADITRTFPIGQPSPRHLAVYAAVERMHAAVFGLLKDGMEVKEYATKAYTAIGEEFKKLGLIATIKFDDTSVFKFMPHAAGHGLGIDVHDPLGRPKILRENMVLTVEVGAYIREEGIGVRLEDDVRLTKTGAVNMSARLPIALAALRKML